jgi:DNA-binding CsgD family transcriptional regulator
LLNSEHTDIDARHSIDEIARLTNKLPGVIIIHNHFGSVVWMSQLGLDLLGITLDEARNMTAAEYYSSFFNPEDYEMTVEKIHQLLDRNNDDEFCTYFQQVRYKGDTDWTWHMNSCKIFARDAEGKPTMTITMAFPLNAMHHMPAKAERLLAENNFLRRNYKLYSLLSRRERDVLRLMALGKTSSETADELFIASHTVESHRKNIKKKLGTSSFFELSQYARAFDLI